MAYRDEIEGQYMRIRILEEEVAELREQNAALVAERERYSELRFDPRGSCAHCGGSLQGGEIVGGKGIVGFHPDPKRTLLGMPRDVEWLARPRLTRAAPVNAARCTKCRKIYIDY